MGPMGWALGLIACGGARTDAPVVAEPAPIAPPAAPADGVPAAAAAPTGSRTMTGTLHFSEAPATMSVEAYNHVTFTLSVDGGESVNLGTTDAVGYDALKALDGKTVTVEATWEEPQVPSDNEAHPIDPMTGEGEKRPGRWLVNKSVPATDR